jgi:hypothetical protein
VALLVLASAAACAPRGGFAPTPVAADGATLEPPARLVLALDGLDYRDIVAARARGLFASFRAPSRLVSTFPAISDIAWHEILGLAPTPGYQRIYYSNAYQRMIGGTLDAISPIEYEQRMDVAFGTRLHHLSAYLASDVVARNELTDATREFFSFAGRRTVYVYNVGPDALQHMKGDLPGYLAHLDARLTALQASYRERTGRELEIVLLSDHGHNQAPGAAFLPVTKTLTDAGYTVGTTVRRSTDVAFSVDGVTTAFGVFAHPDSVPSVARLLGALAGVELVSTRMGDSSFSLQRGTVRAQIDWRHDARGDAYRYVPLTGDPIDHAPIVARMREDGVLDGDGFADAATWTRYSATAAYPVAVVRIARGHTMVTRNPAPILVSAALTHRVGLGIASVTERVVSLGGTHGALSMPGSLGVLMTTFADTHDDLTATVRAQLDGFSDLPRAKLPGSGVRVTSLRALAQDPRGLYRDVVPAPTRADGAPALEVWLAPEQVTFAGDSGVFFVEVRHQAPVRNVDDVIATSRLPMHAPAVAVIGGTSVAGRVEGRDGAATLAWISAPGTARYVLPLERLDLPTLAGDAEYQVRVVIERRVAVSGGGADVKVLDVAKLVVRTTPGGAIAPW